MMTFDFATAHRIRFGWGVFEESGRIASTLGNVAFLVRGTFHPKLDGLRELLGQHRVSFHEFIVEDEPTVDWVKQAIAQAKESGCDFVIGFGGGSVLDTAKAVSAMLTNPGRLEDYLEVIGAGKSLEMPAAPCLAIPTTAGTGSEVTRNAVLGVPEAAIKVSLRSPFMLPAVALVDPALTCSMPPSITAYTGMDALTQVLEPYVSVRANVMTDMFCREGLQRVGKALLAAYKDGMDQEARIAMAWVSLLGGLALANAGLGAVHGLAAPIGGMFKAPHGAICARLLPLVMQANLNALRRRQPENLVIERFREIACWLTQRPDAMPEDGVVWLEQAIREFKIPNLSAYGMTHQHIPVIVERGLRASSMKGNPVPLTPDELVAILEAAL
ncbi:MAG: iron-containing alcohol dehydrogenase [Thermanaerothrix sp.]|nr:iron-containing alcohol dehydrogenase [Thermanaerothrix sp.]